MTFEQLVDTVRKQFSPKDVSSIEGTLAFQFDVEGEAAGTFYVEVKDHSVSVEPYEYYDRNARFLLSDKVLLLLLQGTLNPAEAYLSGKLKVEGDLQKALQISAFL